MTSFFLSASNRVRVLVQGHAVFETTYQTLAGPPALPVVGSPILRVDPRAIAIVWGPAFLALDLETRNSIGTAYESQLSTSPLFAAPTVIVSTVPADLFGTSYGATFGCLTPGTTYYARVRAINFEGIPSAFTSLGSTVTLPAPPPPAVFSWADDRWRLSLVAGDVSEEDVVIFNETPLTHPLLSQNLPEKILAANSKLEKSKDPRRRPLPGGLVEIQTSRSCPARMDSVLDHPATLVYDAGAAGAEVETGAGPTRVSVLSFYRLDADAGLWNKIPSRVEGGKVTASVRELGTLAVMGQADVSLQDLRVSPNPFHQGTAVNMTFANLSERATVTILTPSGREVRRLEETDGDGLLLWDGRNSSGNAVEPGIYIYHVESPGAEKRGKVMVLR